MIERATQGEDDRAAVERVQVGDRQRHAAARTRARARRRGRVTGCRAMLSLLGTADQTSGAPATKVSRRAGRRNASTRVAGRPRTGPARDGDGQ
ncbi:hypothetical protein Psuf_093470 [Phytohabitans suffuscus]|uniref:Uncharacterized protein n=1 Tax=Phytohabitans suffuscus TaxID=624315 RepID=A0A6F8Z132_9ACTN|nr:hypothetical protein Psuf_093470 [Phytohabitans suffuscus]